MPEKGGGSTMRNDPMLTAADAAMPRCYLISCGHELRLSGHEASRVPIGTRLF